MLNSFKLMWQNYSHVSANVIITFCCNNVQYKVLTICTRALHFVTYV